MLEDQFFEYISAKRIASEISLAEVQSCEDSFVDYRLNLLNHTDLLCLHQAVLVPQSYWCFLERQFAVKELMLDFENLDNVIIGPFRRYFSTTLVQYGRRRIVRNVRPHDDPVYINEVALNFSMSVDDMNVFHYLALTLPKLKIIDAVYNGKLLPLLFGYQPTRFQLSLLRLLGVTNPIAVIEGTSVHDESKKRSYQFKRLYSLVSYRGGFSDQIKFSSKRLNSARFDEDGLITYEKIYITRDDAVDQNRELVNEGEIRQHLLSRGFFPIVMSKYSVEQQIHFFQSADIIIFEHGAAGAFIMVSNPTQKIIELCPPLNCPTSNEIATHYRDISEILGLNYTNLVGSEVSTVQIIRYIIPIETLNQTLQTL
jgi:capsular polysaccharide biosynthesis protein